MEVLTNAVDASGTRSLSVTPTDPGPLSAEGHYHVPLGASCRLQTRPCTRRDVTAAHQPLRSFGRPVITQRSSSSSGVFTGPELDASHGASPTAIALLPKSSLGEITHCSAGSSAPHVLSSGEASTVVQTDCTSACIHCSMQWIT